MGVAGDWRGLWGRTGGLGGEVGRSLEMAGASGGVVEWGRAAVSFGGGTVGVF